MKAYINMKISTVEDSNISTSSIINNGTSIALLEWYPASSVPTGEYNIKLVSIVLGLELLLATIQYDDSKKGHWNDERRRLEWLDVDQGDIYGYAIIAERKTKSRSRRDIAYFDGWKYSLLVKQRNDTTDGGIYEPRDVEPDRSMCIDHVYTVGYGRTIGAQCPIDPNTRHQMSSCLNWRRTDSIGIACRTVLSSMDKSDSILHYCSTVIDAEDCRCMNRAHQEDYKSLKLKRSEHDYCWYPPCASGYYLVENKTVSCESKTCQVVYNIDAGNSVGIDSNTHSLKCFTKPLSNSSSVSFCSIGLTTVFVVLLV